MFLQWDPVLDHGSASRLACEVETTAEQREAAAIRQAVVASPKPGRYARSSPSRLRARVEVTSRTPAVLIAARSLSRSAAEYSAADSGRANPIGGEANM